jgi:hypothetical protein
MPRTRTLSLKRETLTELTPTEMNAVAGGSHLCAATDNCTHVSVDVQCPSNPVTNCLSPLIAPTIPCL